MAYMHKPLLIVIAGPTASGKTDVAIQLAQHFNTAILSADSRQCYKELGIGVAKPAAKDLQTVTHHFINSHSIFDTVNAGIYEQYGLEKLHKMFTKKPVAILVGGTGLYIDTLINGIDEIPPTPEAIRAEIIQQYELWGIEWLHKELRSKDPAFFSVAEQQNPQRLMRALEVFNTTGKSIMHFRTQKKRNRFFNTLNIALYHERSVLYERINTRVDGMIKEGLIEEAKQLIKYQDLNALQTVGYKELFAYFKGEISLLQAIDLIKKHTRNYAKRQLTWLRKSDTYHWMHPDNYKEIVTLAEQYHKGAKPQHPPHKAPPKDDLLNKKMASPFP